MIKKILTKEDIYLGHLILVNPSHPIVKPLPKEDLRKVESTYDKIELEKTAKEKLDQILTLLNAREEIIPISGYRTLAFQEELYQKSIKENGLEFTKKYVALPNCSEHQTGLAIDLGLNEENIDFICPNFPNEKIGKKFRESMLDYGFIERYQKEKVEITKISTEPWHFRYIGYPHAKLLTQLGLCLEEYIEYLKQYQGANVLTFKEKEISYLPFKGEPLEIWLEEQDQVSGNNVDGFILTKVKK